MSADTDRLLWPEEVAAKLGVKPATLKRMATDSRRAHEARDAGDTDAVRPTHLPLPVVAKERRQVPRKSGGHDITVDSPRWSEAAIDDYIAHRPGSPGRGAERS